MNGNDRRGIITDLAKSQETGDLDVMDAQDAKAWISILLRERKLYVAPSFTVKAEDVEIREDGTRVIKHISDLRASLVKAPPEDAGCIFQDGDECRCTT